MKQGVDSSAFGCNIESIECLRNRMHPGLANEIDSDSR